MWALVQVHKIQREFLDVRFHNHPSIAPVIVLHVLKMRATRVAHTNAIKLLEGRISALEKNIKDHKTFNRKKEGCDKREKAKKN
jgi:hypothetical protein